MTDSNQQKHPVPGSSEYDEHVKGELEHYGQIFREGPARETLVQPVPASWTEVERRATARVRAMSGDDLNGHVVSRLKKKPGARMLSLGSGPGGVEIGLARQAPHAQIVCMDLNPELLDAGRQRARELGLAVTFEPADLNTVKLPQNEFDIVFCHAALHHVIELEALAEQIKGSLKPEGELITVDVVTPNGYLMWPETREVVRAIFRTLPERFRLNHTGYAERRIDDEIWEVDTSAHSMECARSEDILEVLNRKFTASHFVPYFSISRRFLDTMYGPNYDLNAPLDLALLNWIWELDVHHLATGRLKPETFFGIYRRA